MNAKDVLKTSMDMGDTVLKTYLGDLSDTDLLLRPGKGSNHLAWQLGHLIASEVQLLNSICPNAGIELPPGFAEKHTKETSAIDDPGRFCNKQQYLELYEKQRLASKAALEKMADADFDKPSPEKFRSHFPRVGDMFNLIASHPLMHSGQFVTVRRALGKPVLI